MMKRSLLLGMIFFVSLLLSACKQTETETDELKRFESYDLTDLENCLDTFRDTEGTTICDYTERDALIEEYLNHYDEYFDFASTDTNSRLSYLEGHDNDFISIVINFNEITSEYQSNQYVELYLAIYDNVLEDLFSLATNENVYLNINFDSSNHEMMYVFQYSNRFSKIFSQLKFRFTIEEEALTVLDENFPVIDAELLGDTLSTAIVVVYGNDNDIAVNIDKATSTYKINIQSSSDGEDTTITNQQVIDIISTYLEGYTYLEW